MAERPADFEAYWDGVDEELARYPMAAEMERNALRSTEFATVYNVRLTSIGPYRIFGYYSVPVGDGPFPGLMNAPRYGSVNHVPHYDDRERYATLTLMHRGQRLADQPFAASYPGLLTLGIDSPATYIYRGIVADCLRGAEFLLSRPEVDGEPCRHRRGRSGADHRRAAAAVHRAAGGRADVLSDARSGGALLRLPGRGDQRLPPHLPGAARDRSRTRSPISTRCNHAARVRATTLLITGDAGAINGPEWLRTAGGRARRPGGALSA